MREDEGPNGTQPHNANGVRMTMFYYNADLDNHTSGHFDWDYTEADKCHKPFGGPTWYARARTFTCDDTNTAFTH